jgi:hypothetical protein
MKIYELIKFFEAFDTKIKQKGEVPFRKSSLSDPHITKVVQQVSNETGVPPADLLKKMSSSIDKINEVGKYSPRLYDTLILNSAENAAFELIFRSKKPINTNSVKFDLKIFRELLALVKEDNGAFFPLTAPGEMQRIDYIKPIFVPSTEKVYIEKGFNEVTTAAATPTGDFIFNVDFMNQLLYYGAAVDIQPLAKKYVSNGGTIPNNYCYIEFLIIHELLHYAYGDFKSGRRFKQYGHIAHNWASDFRSNYLLVKSGYTQLPIGLFSDDLNFDRVQTNSYKRLIAAVDAEMKKLPRQLEAWLEVEFDVDNHGTPGQEPEDQEPWEPSIGEIVVHNKEGTFGEIIKINQDGTYETKPVSKEEVAARYPGIKVG